MQKNSNTIFKTSVIFFSAIFLLTACYKKSATPAYLYIKPFLLNTNFATQGTSKNKITDVWVYVNNKPLGAYTLPCNIPIIADGIAEIVLAPGIMKNGISNTRIAYPFYSSHIGNITAKPLSTDTIQPISTYINGLTFNLLEDFETGSTFKKLLGDTIFVRENDATHSLENHYAKLTLDATHDTVEMISSTAMTLPNAGINFVELNYKCDIDFTVGLQATTGSSIVKYWQLTLNPKSDWNKVYIDLSSPLGTLQATSYKLIIKAGNTSGVITAAKNIYLDNIKLISRN